TLTVAAKYCESGDVLLPDSELPPLNAGDILARPAAGAYALAMASNYNLSLRPAVVLVKDGQAKLMRRRETYDDVMRADVWPLEGGAKLKCKREWEVIRTGGWLGRARR